MLKTREILIQVRCIPLCNIPLQLCHQMYNYRVRHPDYLLLDGHTTLLNAGGCLRKNKRVNEFGNCVQTWLEREINFGARITTYQLRQVSRLLVTHDKQTGQQTEEHATETAVPKYFDNMLLADGA